MAYDGSIKIDTAIDGKGFSAGMKQLGSIASGALKGVSTLIVGATAALSAGAFAGVKYNAQMEQYITSFGTMLGGAEKAQKMIASIKKFAAETPFELPDLAKGAQTLLAFGTAEEKIMPTMKMIGDVAQGNKDKFDSLTLAFAQISSTGRLMGQDLLQCINAGFNPLNEISKTTGKSVAQLKDEMAKGAISADMVAAAFQHATSEGGQFYNAMSAQSKTFNGQLSTMKDSAISFVGEMTQGFADELKDTALPMVNDWLSDLQGAFRIGGAAALTRSFGDVLSEAVSAVAAQAPGVIESASDIINAFVRGLQKNAPKLADAALDIVSALVKGIAKILPREITKPVHDAMDAIEKSLRSGGLKNAVEVFKKMLSSLGDVIGGIAKTVLPIFTAAIDALGGSMKVLAPLVTAAVVAVTGWKIAQQAKLWIDLATNAIAAFHLATAASATANGIATASLTMSQLAYGTLTDGISLASAAQSIFNVVLNANPIGLVVTAVAAFSAGLYALHGILDTSKEKAQQLFETFDTMGKGFAEFGAGISTAKSYLGSFNMELFASSEQQAELQANMQEVQSGITAICQLATAERRNYTEAEIVQLETYFARLKELNEQQFALENARMEAIKQQAITAAETRAGSLAEYQVHAQEWIATAQEQRDKQIALVDEQTSTELVLLNQRYGSEAVMTNTSYAAEYNALLAQKQAKIDVVNRSVGEIIASYASGYAQKAGILDMESRAVGKNNASIDSENARHLDFVKKVNADYIGDSIEKNMLIDDEELRHSENLQTIWGELSAGMTEEQKAQLGTYLELCVQSDLYGGKLETKAQTTTDKIITSFSEMPTETREAMSNAMSPMLEEMNRAEKDLYAKADTIANGILSRLRRAFDERSPSRATRKIFRYAMLGGELGLEDEKKNLFSMADNIGKDFIATMRAAVQSQHAVLGEKFAATTAYKAARFTPFETPASSDITVKQDINFNYPMQAPDEVARALRQSTRQQLAGAL